MNRTLTRNATANVFQTVASGLLLFFLYRYINSTLGVDKLGVWSVVLATVSTSRLAEMGLSGGVVRFVARDRAGGNHQRAAEVIDTASISVSVVVGLFLPLLLPFLNWLMPYLFAADYVSLARQLLPFTLVSLWLATLSAVFQGGLDGCEQMDRRAGLATLGQALMVVLAVILVPQSGLIGLAWAQIGQGVFLVVGGRWLLRRALPGLDRVPRHWHKSILREMLGYGANLQAATVAMFLFEPATKALMARVGGPSAAGYFEMANQVVLKVRSVIVTANRAIVPHVAGLSENASDRLRNLYRQNVRGLVYVTVPTLALLVAWSGFASWLLLGAYDPRFAQLMVIIAFAWSLNIMASPAYFANMGSGRVGWNTLSHVVIGLLNVVGGLVVGALAGSVGVALAYAGALVAGSWLLIIVFQRKHDLVWALWRPKEHLPLAVAGVAVMVFGSQVPLRPGAADSTELFAAVVVPLTLLGATAWTHPIRREIVSALRRQSVG